ncbi:MAG: hypothetical protein GY780_17915 [bacterium]|nr:hypothetical protein [bacterium]
MKRSALILMALVIVTVWPGESSAKRRFYPHQEYFDTYEGPETCLFCHEEEATSFFHSQHYQWEGEAPGIVNADGERLGKMNTMNDFCTNPLASWIGNAVNSDGKVIAQGCSKCHAGLGKVPTREISQDQLENIDCLICHASGYRRDAYQDEDGNWEWRPILWKNQRGMDSISKRISLPKRKMCLRCHSAAGGGPNFKRGDIEYEMADCTPDFDVHMATEGNNMQCIDCHAGDDHRVRGRGTDLSGTDSPDDLLFCTECHEEKPHNIPALDHHTDKVYCTVCHITEFAKSDKTDMVRDWSTPKFHEKGNKYSATITFGENVVPEYAWYNGQTKLMKMGDKVRYNDDGTITIMEPQGKRKDKHSKIYAFKLHKGVLPIWKEKDWLIPLAVDEFFITGDIATAVNEGSAAAYGEHHPDYEWVNTKRYMGIFHEVRPADKALQCLDCHQEGGRMNWKALGYKEDPILDALD